MGVEEGVEADGTGGGVGTGSGEFALQLSRSHEKTD